ncbi:acryloyl-CoA reductase [Lacticigenium naphthae]|uniref:acrylyl-CoA reductase family protein n=1 Tax=Lacticigenium naphthae TaxID=515351 RepID=UPI00042A535E|nr:acryloyl-CoA reductase [Lacticigenium naphthae]
MKTFRALWSTADEEGKVSHEIKEMSTNDLPRGDLLIKVHYSSVNYKDGLAGTNARTGVIKSYPTILGIDLSGEIVESATDEFKVGELVVVTGFEFGVNHFGAYSEYARVPKEWAIRIPESLTTRETMIIGTAGFTAAQSIVKLIENGLNRESGPLLVRGATGGLGSLAIQMLSNLGFTVIAESRKKAEQEAYLKKLGASTVTLPGDNQLSKKRPLAKQLWQAVIDPVGGAGLGDYLAQIKHSGYIALSGNVGGLVFETTVLPFILRGITLFGIDSVQYPIEKRRELWERLGSDLKPTLLEETVDHEITLEDLPQAFRQIMDGKMKGRILVKVN